MAMSAFCGIFLALAFVAPVFSLTTTWRASTDAARWVDKGSLTSTAWSANANYLEIIPDSQYQIIDGWGGSFNERGWQTLEILSKGGRDSVIRAIFDTSGLNFDFCRVPLGASDFSFYSGVAVQGGQYTSYIFDKEMRLFSIENDSMYQIPYMRAAMVWQPNLRVWASPWYVPAGLWNNELATEESTVMPWYALYLEKFATTYRSIGINICAIALHNEPDIWSTDAWNKGKGPLQANFIKNYWGPLFQKNHIPVEMWLGTYWNPDHLNTYILPVLNDAAAKQYLSCIGLQGCCNQNWQTQLHQSYPEKKIIETEGLAWENPTWEGGMNIYKNMYSWLSQWCNLYTQWNIILPPKSDGGSLDQGAMIVVSQSARTVDYTPHYYAAKHFSYYVKPYAHRVKSVDNSGISGQKIAFRNSNGDIIVVMASTDAASRPLIIKLGDQMLQASVPANSINTFRISASGAVDNTPHPVPGGLAANKIDCNEIAMGWNAAPGAACYLLYRDGQNICKTFETFFVDKGLPELTSHRYEVSAVNLLRTEGPRSAPVTVSTIADNIPPAIAGAFAVDQTTVEVVFSKPVEQSSAEASGNYILNSGSGSISVSSARLQTDPAIVRLTTSPLTANQIYTLSVRNVKDRSMAHNIVTVGATAQFGYMKNGLTYEYFEASGLNTVKMIPALGLTRTGIATNIGLSMQPRTDDFALRFRGFIRIPSAGQYGFFTTSDDGSQMFIDTVLVSDNDGSHGMTEKGRTIPLTAGFHTITVLFYQGNGGSGLTTAWTPQGGVKQAIPDSVLFVDYRPKNIATGAGDYMPVQSGRQQEICILAENKRMEISFTASDQFTAGIYDMKGRLVKSWAGKKSGTIHLSMYTAGSGAYVVRVTTQGRTLCRQVAVK